MLFTNEPRVALGGTQLFGGEDLVLVTADGSETLTADPRTPLGLDADQVEFAL
jgi:Xaa-Pro aminopeptidase